MELTITKSKQDLEQLEGVIQKNLGTFYEVGRALMEIRNKELYKIKNGGEFQTFEAYCRGVWDFQRAHAYRLMDSVKVVDNVSDSETKKPVNLEQTRPLAKLEAEQQREVWKKAVETAPEGKVTAAHVSRVVKEMTAPIIPKEPKRLEPGIPEHAIYFAVTAISHLERISDDDPTRAEALSKVEKWIAKNK